MRRSLAVGVAACTAVVLAAVAGCSGSGSSGAATPAGPAGTSGSAAPPARPAFDPPTRFDAASGVALPVEAAIGKVDGSGTVDYPLPVLLYGTRAYVASPDRVQVVDTTSGQVVATVRPQHRPAAAALSPLDPAGSNPADAPVLATVAGRTLVLYPFVVTVPGQGTTPSHRAVELVALDPATAGTAWTVQVDLAPWASEPTTTVAATAVGVGGQTAVIRVRQFDGRGSQATYAVDLATRRPTWNRQQFGGYAVTDTTVVGTVSRDEVGIDQRVGAVAVDTGRPRWTAADDDYQLRVSAGGPSAVVAIGRDYGSGQHFLRLLDPDTGAVRYHDTADYTTVTCSYDGRSTTVCARNITGQGWAGAFDPRSAKWLWQLPDSKANRVAPVVTAVWHSAVYGYTDNGPVVLDARTGKDRQPAPGAAPYVVDGSVGIGLDKAASQLRAYPAAG